MRSEWTTVRIEGIAEKIAMGPFGSSIKVETFVDDGIPIISGAHLSGFRVEDGKFNFITLAHADKLRNANVRRGDVIFTHAGNVGQVAYIPRNSKFERYVISQRQFYLRCDPHKADPAFITYFFHGSAGRHQLLANKSQVGVPSISRPTSNLKTIEVLLPGLDEQRAIAGFLDELADRMDNLRATNATLEAIAQALFKSWFVDFDPVHAKVEGRAPAGMDAATAALFPSEFEDSELGPIPKGWAAGSLSDLVDLNYGKALKSADRQPGEVPVYGSGGVTGTHDRALIDGPTVIVGRKGTVGSLFWESRSCFPIDTVFYVVPKLSLHYCYYAMQRIGLDQMNTDAAVPGLNRANAYRQPVLIPATGLLSQWDELGSSIRRRIDQADQRIETLTSLRDTLLPRLISGKLRLPDAEAEVAVTEAAR